MRVRNSIPSTGRSFMTSDDSQTVFFLILPLVNRHRDLLSRLKTSREEIRLLMNLIPINNCRLAFCDLFKKWHKKRIFFRLHARRFGIKHPFDSEWRDFKSLAICYKNYFKRHYESDLTFRILILVTYLYLFRRYITLKWIILICRTRSIFQGTVFSLPFLIVATLFSRALIDPNFRFSCS